MDINNVAPRQNSSEDISITEKPRVLELAQERSNILSKVTVTGAEAYVKNKHIANKSEDGDVSGGDGDDIARSHLNPNEFSPESNLNIESSKDLMDKLPQGVENIDISKLAEAAAENTQMLGNLAVRMLPVPKQMQEVTARAVSMVAFEVFTTVFDVSVSFTNFNSMGFALKRIQSELEELQKKMDMLLRSDYDTATHRLEHAMNYLENTKMHPEAYDEFKEVLRKANEAFPKLDQFPDKLFVQRISIFARFMTHCYDKTTKQFVPLSSLPVEDKKTIANAVFIDLKLTLKEFKKLKIPFFKKVMGLKKEAQDNQNILDSLMKVCLPIIWHYHEMFNNSDTKEMLEYIPEGEDDSAIITLEPGVDISVWKELDLARGGKDFVLRWKNNQSMDGEDPFHHVFNGPFKALNTESCHSISELKIVKKLNGDKIDSFIQVTKFEDFYKLNFDCEPDNITIKYIGSFGEHIISLHEDEISKWVNLPTFIRMYARDNDDMLMIHWLLWFQKDLCDDNLIKHFLNKTNSNFVDCEKRNVLHWALLRNDDLDDLDDLEIVRRTLKYGGPIKQTEDDHGYYPSERTTNREIKQLLKEILK